jgi:ParB family chromosome partitioning protein
MNPEVEKIIEKIKVESDIIKIARLLNYLVKDKQIRIVELAKIFKWKSSYICNVIRLLKLPEIVIDGYYSKQLSISHMIVISRLKDQNQMIDLYEKVLSGNLTVLKTEEIVRDMLYQISTDDSHISKDVIEKIKENFQKINPDLKVKVIQTRIRTKVILQLEGSTKKTNLFLKVLAN